MLLAPVTFFKFFQSAKRLSISAGVCFLSPTAKAISIHHIDAAASCLYRSDNFSSGNASYHIARQPGSAAEGIPFPGLVEALLMEITFEVLREAGVHIPGNRSCYLCCRRARTRSGSHASGVSISGDGYCFIIYSDFQFCDTSLRIYAIAARLIRFSLMLCAGVLGFLNY